MSGPTWRERLFGGFRKTSERLSENLAAAAATAAPVPDLEAEDDDEPGADPTPEPVSEPARVASAGGGCPAGLFGP